MKTLFIMCGAPGTGKSYIVKKKFLPHAHYSYVSRDEVRFDVVEEDEDYFSHEKEVFRLFVAEIVHNLKNPIIDCVVADATHINWASRKKLINAIGKELPLDGQLNIVPVVVKCSLEKAITRNATRNGRTCVPEKAVRDMYARFQDPKNDPFEYDGIMYVDGGRDDM